MEYAKALLTLHGPAAIYLIALFLGLYLHYLVAKKNNRTSADNFSDYWLVETPGLSIAVLVTLATAASVVIGSGMLDTMSGLNIFIFGFGKAYFFDSVIQAPPAATAAAPAIAPAAAPKQAGFARIGFLIALAMLSGCVALGLATPKTPTQDLAYAVSIHEGLARGLTNATASGAVSPADASKVETYLLQTKIGMSAARTSLGGCLIAGQPVTTVQGVAPAPAPAPGASLPGIAGLAVQAVACSPNSTAVDQLVLVNNILQQLAAYYATRGIKTGP